MSNNLRYKYLKNFIIFLVFIIFSKSVILAMTEIEPTSSIAAPAKKVVKAPVIKKARSSVAKRDDSIKSNNAKSVSSKDLSSTNVAAPVSKKPKMALVSQENKAEGFGSSYVKKDKDVVSGMNDTVGIEGFDEKEYSEARKIAVKNLVEKAIKFFEEHGFAESMNAFTYSKEFFSGELHLFVYDYEGVCLAHGDDRDLIWQNRMEYKDNLGLPVTQMIIDTAKRGGGWINYQKKNATKVNYVKGAQKGDQKIIIGSGFYPLSKRDAVVSLVRNAVDDFNNSMAAKRPISAAFSEFSYPLGRFVVGDLYIFALDFEGNIVAQGDIQGIIGTNAIDNKDESGKFINREIIAALKNKDKTWTEYISKGAKKLTYSEKVTDKNGKNYFIACGYYPETDRKKVVELVKKGYAYMSKWGANKAAETFTERADQDNKDYRFGDLFLMVYDYTGKCIAHGSNRDLVGKPQYDVKDDAGRYPIREILDKAKAGGGWVNYKVKNSYMFTYVEEVTVAAVKHAICCGTFPTSKPETMQLIVKDAAGSIRDFGPAASFAKFAEKEGKFIKGDIEVFVYETSGYCLVDGYDYNHIWKNMLDAKDDDGRQFVKLIINTAKEGSGTAIYKEKGKQKIVYVMKVDKDGRSYAVGSGFYLK